MTGRMCMRQSHGAADCSTGSPRVLSLEDRVFEVGLETPPLVPGGEPYQKGSSSEGERPGGDAFKPAPRDWHAVRALWRAKVICSSPLLGWGLARMRSVDTGSARRNGRMKTYIINPPSPLGMTASRDAAGGFGTVIGDEVGPSYPVLDIAYSAAVLSDSGVEVKIRDAVAIPQNAEDIAAEILSDGADLVFVRTSTPTYEIDVANAGIIKRRTEAKVILFGPHVSYIPERAFPHDDADGMLQGEPEFSIGMMASGADWSSVPGLLLRRGDSLLRGPRPGLNEDLDGLPFPAWEFMPYDQYVLDDLSDHVQYLTVLSSRGCFFNCGYCPYPVSQGKRMRMRSVTSVVRELAYISERFSAQYAIFRDPLFTYNRSRTKELCRAIRACGIEIGWRCETRAELLPPDLLREMADAGCRGLNIGVETVQPDALNSVNRRVTNWKRYRDVFAQCRALGIKTFAFFLIGLPGETKESFFQTIEFAKELDPDAIQFSVLAPYPGTAVMGSENGSERVVANGEARLNFTERSTLATLNLRTDEIDELRAYAERSVGGSWRPASRKG
jgi:anaerobic magnesium-protoporphyrin IX monomethyl ester cyclase